VVKNADGTRPSSTTKRAIQVAALLAKVQEVAQAYMTKRDSTPSGPSKLSPIDEATFAKEKVLNSIQQQDDDENCNNLLREKELAHEDEYCYESTTSIEEDLFQATASDSQVNKKEENGVLFLVLDKAQDKITMKGRHDADGSGNQ
jgi:hypothetical protein